MRRLRRRIRLGDALGLAPAAEDEAAERETEPERPDGEAADRKRFPPFGKALPAPERLPLLRGQRLAAALLTDRAAGAQSKVEIVEDLSGLVGHGFQSIACPGGATDARSAPLRPPLRCRRRRGDRTRSAGPDRAFQSSRRHRERRSQSSWPRRPTRTGVALPSEPRPPG